MTIFPFIILKQKELKSDELLINHEKIHLRQQLELLIVPFYLFYLIEFTVRIIQYREVEKAYFNISFEREAYDFDQDLNYLNQRKWYNWTKFLNIK